MTRALAIAAALACGWACGAGSPAPVDLSPTWPANPPDLARATEMWTRSDKVVAGFSEQLELIAEVSATYRSPAWRAALVRREARNGELTEAAIAARLEEQKKAAAEHHEFVLLMTTHDRRINDLTKGERSVWSLRLRDSTGGEVAPVEVKKDRRPRSEIETELPHLGDFDEIYIVKFPGDHPILAEGAERFSLKMWSGRGSLELVWRDR